MMIKLVKVGVKKLLTPIEAQDLFDETYVAIQKWDEQGINIRRYFYKLICGDAFVELEKFDSEKALFQELCNLSTLHRSTLYDYKNAALIEVELCLEHGRISVNALLELKTNTTEDSRKEIWPIVENMCRFDEKNPIPTKPIIAQAKKYYHHNNTPEGKAEREAFFNTQHDELTYISVENDDQNRQMTAEKALGCIKKYTFKELELLSKRIFPTSKVGKDAYQILRETTDDELEEFKAELHALCETRNDHEYTDDELEKLKAEHDALYEASNDGAYEFTDEELEEFKAEYLECGISDNYEFTEEELEELEAEYREVCEISA